MVFEPERAKIEVALFCTTLATPLPIAPVIVVVPVPVPEFVRLPLNKLVPETVIAEAAFALSVSGPLPVRLPAPSVRVPVVA